VNTSYDVIVTREDGAWLANVPAVPGAHTIDALIDQGYSVRDAAELLAITAGRVSQIASR